MLQPNELGTPRQPAEHGFKLAAHFRKALPAGSAAFARINRQVDRALRILGERQRQLQRQGNGTVKHRASHVLAMPAEVDQGGPGPIGSAPEIDAGVAEGGADLVEVVHRHWRGVEAQIGVVPLHALAQSVDDRRVAEDGVQIKGIEVAFQSVGLSRASLVHENKIPLGPNLPEGSDHGLAQVGGPCPGAADQHEQRIRLRSSAQCRIHDYIQVDPPARPAVAVLEDRDLAAERVVGALAGSAVAEHIADAPRIRSIKAVRSKAQRRGSRRRERPGAPKAPSPGQVPGSVTEVPRAFSLRRNSGQAFHPT